MIATETEIYKEPFYLKDIENIEQVLEFEPKKDWLKIEKLGGKEFLSLPIEKVEFLLKRLFKHICIEVKEQKEGAKLLLISVRIHYTNREGTRLFQDGTASVGLIGAAPWGLSQAIKSMAIKDSAHHLGKIFGRDLNRIDIIPTKESTTIDLETITKLFKEKENLLSPQDKEAALRIITEKETNSYKKLYNQLSKI